MEGISPPIWRWVIVPGDTSLGRLHSIIQMTMGWDKEEIKAFQDIRRYRFFNTNNIWVNLEFLIDLILKHRFIDLPMIVNPKTVVPRSHFLPVKTCSDLLALRSDCFVYSAREGLTLNPDRAAAGRTEAIKIKLDSKYYGKFDWKRRLN